jgi:hypothetical protein
VLALALLAVVGILVLAGCVSADSEAARRANAEAALVRAEGQAYAERVRADAAAAAERANVRQMERDASHQRVMEVLPVLVILVGALLLAGLATAMFWDLRRQTSVSDPRLLVLLERLQLDQAERDRQLLGAIANLDRRTLPAGDDRAVIIYTEGSQGPCKR